MRTPVAHPPPVHWSVCCPVPVSTPASAVSSPCPDIKTRSKRRLDAMSHFGSGWVECDAIVDVHEGVTTLSSGVFIPDTTRDTKGSPSATHPPASSGGAHQAMSADVTVGANAATVVDMSQLQEQLEFLERSFTHSALNAAGILDAKLIRMVRHMEDTGSVGVLFTSRPVSAALTKWPLRAFLFLTSIAVLMTASILALNSGRMYKVGPLISLNATTDAPTWSSFGLMKRGCPITPSNQTLQVCAVSLLMPYSLSDYRVRGTDGAYGADRAQLSLGRLTVSLTWMVFSSKSDLARYRRSLLPCASSPMPKMAKRSTSSGTSGRFAPREKQSSKANALRSTGVQFSLNEPRFTFRCCSPALHLGSLHVSLQFVSTSLWPKYSWLLASISLLWPSSSCQVLAVVIRIQTEAAICQ